MSDRRLKDLADEQIILEFQETNDVELFEALVQRYKNPLFNFVFRFLGDRDATADVVQETFIKVYRNKDSYKTFAKFSTWIYTIAGNLAKTELQRRKRKNQVSIHSWGEDEETIELPDGGPLPDRLVDSGIKNKMIQEALLKLPEVYREMVILRDIQELSYEEIAEMMDISIGTVKSRINRGRAQLQELLRDIYKE
ncbi:MAG: sigma-70 family RNA polymerase sigma factor [Ignavibacteriales bacterium]|nr:ECF RNA polymerase sigma factor SigW [Ignavibacteriaceae bacterium]MCZ2142760.1 sigma-70 family RNA polymerase sigma factor [Ignavibacteriales bacterium]WKZ71477.1 MAG: sigma-70 family RNA polymerase sigma factor [Ignavibacteriaceae bacterium]